MILIFALVGSFSATIAGLMAMIAGQPWWIGLASYIGAGTLTVSVLAVFMALQAKDSPRKGGGPVLGAGLPIAEH